ncbi:unnamed protein product [Cladocopium goreaui]|uniref:Enoyl-CoA hydratase, mitochondrial n=1 Tax=Cladocopium goreaui TaxID=2562237 RepID=A0A9P1FUA1_9DINO|nr:unnamed protein product [Cladocopium goreaui]
MSRLRISAQKMHSWLPAFANILTLAFLKPFLVVIFCALPDTKLANDKRYLQAAKKALCEVPPVRLQCTGGKNPKCIDADWTPPPPPKPKFPRICGFLNPTPKVPERPPVLTWQIAREGVGGVCKEDPPEPGAGVDEVQQGFGPAKRRVRENCSLEWSRNGHGFFWAIHLLPIALRRLPQLTVALLQGTAMGAGIGLVCACDYVISAKGAFFTMSEAKLGAVPSAALPYITRRCTFIKNVYQLVLAGARLTAEVAEEYGFVDKVVDDVKDLEAECQAVCDRMTLCAPGAVAATKEVVMNTVGVPPSSFMLNYVAGIVADIRKGPESKAGMEAVMSKSRPKWADTAVVP